MNIGSLTHRDWRTVCLQPWFIGGPLQADGLLVQGGGEMNQGTVVGERGRLDAVLLRASRGEASYRELAGELILLEDMVQFVPDGEHSRLRREAQQAASSEKALGDGDAPKVAGIRTADGGFVPWVFTDDVLAREFAVARGIIEPDGEMPLILRSAEAVFRDCLAFGQADLVVDDGSDRKLNLQRKVVARLYALMVIERFAALPELYAVALENSVFYQRPKQGEGIQAFVYDSPDAMRAGFPRIQERVPEMAVRTVSTRKHITGLLEAGVTLLVVNPGLATEMMYTRDDLARMTGPAERSAG